MRFSTAIIAGSFAVLASAASETSAAQPASTNAVDQCLAKCPAADVNCKAHCIAVPSPDQNQANANTECARKCPQGSGSPEDTKKFGDCLAKCAHDNYYQTSVGTPESTGTPNSGDGGNNGGNNGGSGGNGNSGSGGNGSNSSAGSGGNGGDASNTSAGSGGSGSDATGTGATKPTGTAGGNDASKTGSDAKATESGKGDDKKNGAAGLVASSAALFGAVVALFAL